MTAVLVTGGSGFLGNHVVRHLLERGDDVVATFDQNRERVPNGARAIALDLTDDASIEAVFKSAWPEVIVHTAAISDLRSCEVDPDRAQRVNVQATIKLARMAATLGSRFLLFSTDQVFDGTRSPWLENDVPKPLHAYGRSKVDAERELRRVLPTATVLRVALAYGRSPSGDRSASEKIVLDLRSGRRAKLFADEMRTPVAARDVARATVAAIPERDLPIVHVAGGERMSRYDFGVRVARAFRLDPNMIDPVRLDEVDMMPKRPKDLALDVQRMRSVLRCPPEALEVRLAEDFESSP